MFFNLKFHCRVILAFLSVLDINIDILFCFRTNNDPSHGAWRFGIMVEKDWGDTFCVCKGNPRSWLAGQQLSESLPSAQCSLRDCGGIWHAWTKCIRYCNWHLITLQIILNKITENVRVLSVNSYVGYFHIYWLTLQTDLLIPLWIQTTKPYIEVIDEWITNGNLLDPRSEFILKR